MAVIVSVLATLVGVGIGNRLAVRSTDTADAPITRTVPTRPGSTLPPSSSQDPSSQDPTGQQPSTGGATADANAVADKVTVGLVDINTRLGYRQAQAAGTGMVLTSSGRILTNNHVIKGATEIEVTVIPTGKQYTAHVVGTSPTEDVAVLELDKASGLTTIPLGDSSKVRVGDAVVALGNAGGKGGAPHVVTGSVEALDQEITASDQSGADAEQLTGLLQVNAGILPGDSGGALANADGQVIGMNTAASSSNQFQSASSQGFAIPIAHALSIAKEITAGHASATIHIGLPALLGVQVSPSGSLGGNSQGGYGGNTGGTTSNGADVAGVASGSPADKLGIVAGDTVTAIDGDAVTTPESLSTIIRTHQPGEQVTVTWTDQSGTRHSGSATLITGPAD